MNEKQLKRLNELSDQLITLKSNYDLLERNLLILMERDIEVTVLYTFKDPRKKVKPDYSENEEIQEMIDKVRQSLTYKVHFAQDTPKVEEGESVRITLDTMEAMNNINESLMANKRKQRSLEKEVNKIVTPKQPK